MNTQQYIFSTYCSGKKTRLGVKRVELWFNLWHLTSFVTLGKTYKIAFIWKTKKRRPALSTTKGCSHHKSILYIYGLSYLTFPSLTLSIYWPPAIFQAVLCSRHWVLGKIQTRLTVHMKFIYSLGWWQVSDKKKKKLRQENGTGNVKCGWGNCNLKKSNTGRPPWEKLFDERLRERGRGSNGYRLGKLWHRANS